MVDSAEAAEAAAGVVQEEAGRNMKTKHFLNQLEKDRLIAAIKEAELGNSSDVVLFINHKKVDDAMSAAHGVFTKLKLSQTTPQNSVLVFLAPESQKLAVIGGADLYKVLPPEWWSSLISKITTSFVGGRLTEGLLAGLHEIGTALRLHFPVETKVDRSGQTDLMEER